MSFQHSDYIQELNELNQEIKLKNPSDVLQFCANYFNQRLEQQRASLWQQTSKAEAAGVTLFPSLEESKLEEQRKSIPSFKTPFGDNDPHSSTHGRRHPEVESNTNALNGLFKGSFDVGQTPSHKVALEVDPNDPSASESTAPGPSVTPTTAKVTPTTAGANAKGGASNLPRSFNAHRRISVSAEILNPESFSGDSWKPPRHNVTPDQLLRMKKTVAKNFLFSGLEDDSLVTLIYALEEKKVAADTEIIKQGDEGDFFYVIESGTVDFYVNGAKVNTSGPGSSFGELALMYNSPRAATAIASTDCILWALDRLTFRRILLEGTAKRRLMYEEFLKEVNVLKPLNAYERNKLADALHTEQYSAGEEIITEGEQGENFYIIESGDAQISKKKDGVIGQLHPGDYFGEVALLNDLPRQATITALTNVKVVTLGKSGFQRLLGPAVEETLKQHDPTQSQ